MKMSQEPCPLVQVRGLKVFPTYNDSATTLDGCDVVITAFGMDVLAGKVDGVAKKGIDEWYGGVHLQGQCPRWRWHSSLQQIHDTGTDV